MSRNLPTRACASALALLALAASTAPAQQTPQHEARVRLFTSPTTSIAGPALLSRDGQWLVFSIMESPGEAFLAVSRAGGGEPLRLTTPGSWDGNPEWSSAGNAIYFVSNRGAPAGDQNYYAMVLPFDASSGRAGGEPRQLTSDPVWGSVRVSPDGQSLAFIDAADRRLLKIVATGGGEPTLVARIPPRSGNLAWSRDGHDLYFVTSVPDQSHRILHRVPAGGGEVVVVSRELPPQGQFLIAPGAEMFLLQENEPPRERLLKVVDRRGTVLTTITTTPNTRGTQFTPDGQSLIAVEIDVVAPTRIVPISGGAHRDVTPPTTYDWVATWSPDGSTLYTWTEHGGASVLAAVPLAGGTARTFPDSAGWAAQGANSRYVFQATRRDGTRPRSLAAIDLRDGTRYLISENLPGHNMIFPYGPGGTWAAHEELYFLERNDGRLDVKAWRGPDEVRQLRSLPLSFLGRTNVAVHGDRVAWQEERGDSVDLMIADGAITEPQRLLTVGRTPGSNEISFSRDGRLLVSHYTDGSASSGKILFADPSGATPPRIVETGLSYWYWPRWLPDNSGVLVIGGGAGAEAQIVRIPVAEGAPVAPVTHDATSKWGFELSPDGRFVAYPAEIWRGSTVWRFDIAAGTR
jgi:Tol biopolymer transport system component